MPAKLWTGTISFGLVAIPVSLVPATRESRVTFHLLHDADYARCVRQMRCVADDEVMQPEHLVHGVEVDAGRMIVVSEQELAGLAVERSTTIEIERFVDEDALPALFLERPYYLLSDGVVKPYRLLVAALRERRRIGLATFVIHTREHLVGIRALDDLLCLQVLRFTDELRSADEIRPTPSAVKPKDQAMFTQLVEEMSGPFASLPLIDAYQLQVKEYLRQRQLQQGTVTAPPGEQEGEAEYTDLMAVLEESMTRARARRGHAA